MGCTPLGRRQVGGPGPAAGGGVAEPGLHDAVLAGVVREHRAAPTGLQGGEPGVDGGRQHVELGVHRDADRLEGALGRVTAGAAGRRGDGVAHDLGQLGGGGDGTGGDDRPGDAAGVALVAEGSEQAGQLLLVGVVHDVGGRARLALVHAHVEGGVVPVAEAAVGAVELGAADPQVEEHAAHRCRVQLFHDVVQGVEPGAVEADSVPEGLEPFGRRGEGVAVLVEPQHPEVLVGFQQRRGVSPATDGGVDHPAGWHRGEQLDDALLRAPARAGTPRPPRRRRRSPAAPREAVARRDVSPERTRWEASGEGAFHRAARGTAGERRRSSHLGCRPAPLCRVVGGWGGHRQVPVRARSAARRRCRARRRCPPGPRRARSRPATPRSPWPRSRPGRAAPFTTTSLPSPA